MQFNFISQYYDLLNRLVFGTRLDKAKVSLFNHITEGNKVLFIGGGTGLSLLRLLSKNQNLAIDFVDSSSQMISIAKRRVKENGTVEFHITDIKQFDGSSYDVIITEFFFDLFTKDNISKLIELLSQKLTKNGVWIDTDFRKPSTLKNRATLKLMYLFFKITAKLKTNILVNTQPFFETNGFKIDKELKFNSGFISSQLIVAT